VRIKALFHAGVRLALFVDHVSMMVKWSKSTKAQDFFSIRASFLGLQEKKRLKTPMSTKVCKKSTKRKKNA